METSHINRWVTALIALPLLVLVILKGGAFLLTLLLVFVSGTALYEWNSITSLGRSSLKIPGIIPFFLIPFVHFASFYSGHLYFLVILLSAGIILYGGLKYFDESEEHFKGVVYIFSGFVYTSVFLSFLGFIRQEQSGAALIFFVLVSVFASDTGAFYAGRNFGKTKLMPKVSPKKTVEGFAGGFILSIISAVIFKLIFLDFVPFFNALLCGIAAGIATPLGDLFESMLKRVFNVKDSGTILPGHGGILDRIDGLLFAAPFFYIFLNI